MEAVKLFTVLNKMGEMMGFETDFRAITYDEFRFEDFLGVYYGQSALNLACDTLVYLESLLEVL